MAEAPHVPGLPLLGNLPALQRDPLGFFERARDTWGDVVRVKFGPRNGVIVCDPAWVEYILVDKQRSFSKKTRGYDVLRRLLGNGLVTSEGNFWLRQRRIAQPAFHRERIAGFATLMQAAARDVVADWDPFIASGKDFDVSAEMMRLTMRIVGESLLSTDVTKASSSAALGSAIGELLHQAIRRTQSVFVFPDAVPTPMNRRFQRAKAQIDSLVHDVIARRRAGEDKPDLLSMLMNASDEETGEKMSDAQLRDEVMTMFLAGHETTANLLAWTFFLLGEHPAVEEKLRAEIDGAVGGAAATVENVMRLPLLDAVLKETLRLYPPIWILARYSEENDVIGGYPVRAGDIVFAAPWLLHRHPRLWRDALSFKPERFLEEPEPGAPGGPPRYAYFPFSGGPRKCIGDFFAQLEAKIILVTVLQRVRLALVPGHAVVPEPTVTLRPRGGVRVVASLRAG